MEMKQRIIGIIVLIALGIILLPLIFDSEPQSAVPSDAQMAKQASALDSKKHLHKVVEEAEPDQDIATESEDSSDRHAAHEHKAPHHKPALEEEDEVAAETPEIDESLLHKPVAELAHNKNQQPELEGDSQETKESAPVEEEVPIKVEPKPLPKATPKIQQAVNNETPPSTKTAHKIKEPKVEEEEAIKIEPKPLAKPTKAVAKSEHKPKMPATAQNKKSLSKPDLIKQDIEREINTEMAATAAGWGVQLGVFADRSNANELVKRLQKHGFHAFVKIEHSGKKKIAKVYIGPEANRQAADKTLRALKSKMQLSGIVVRVRA